MMCIVAVYAPDWDNSGRQGSIPIQRRRNYWSCGGRDKDDCACNLNELVVKRTLRRHCESTTDM